MEKHAQRKLKLYKKGHYDLCLMIRQVHRVHCYALEKCNYTALHIRHIKAIVSEVFKSLNNLNPNFRNKMFQVKDITYELKDSKFNKITYGKKTFSYILWNSYLKLITQQYKAMHN